MITKSSGLYPVLYLHEYQHLPADILRWKNDEDLKSWKPDILSGGDLEDPNGIKTLPPRLCVGIGSYKTTLDGEIYLCILIEPESRKVMAASIGVFRSAELVGKALEELFSRYETPEIPLVIRSSQNPLYKTKVYGEVLAKYPVRAEMTEKGTRGGVMAVSTFYSQLMRRKGNRMFRDWQEAVDWLSAYIFRYH